MVSCYHRPRGRVLPQRRQHLGRQTVGLAAELRHLAEVEARPESRTNRRSHKHEDFNGSYLYFFNGIYIYMCVCDYMICVCVCIYLFICLFVCLFIYLYVWFMWFFCRVCHMVWFIRAKLVYESISRLTCRFMVIQSMIISYYNVI